ncbi:MAG TPA: hypothetical protein VJ306_10720 [Pyrinomonadaceae bacterium]|jgi:hypothetical protein|nr:hypothetical protein [Pyrinomonadaceae bacterium]
MKRILTAICLCLSLFVIGANAQRPDGPLTNASIIKLVKAGFKEKTVIAIIGSQPNDFKLDTEQLINLKRNGVNEDIILAMLSAQLGTVVVNEDEWSNDQFFKEMKKSNEGEAQGSGTSIFGSGSSSRSSSRSRGGLGGNENEGNLSGSATVRIIKPPVEGGENATPKLEKTPTLTNEGVIRLVEAGFSEGTIIKRIEESPVDFDLTPAKVVELQKRRVTEAIIAAMNAAMGTK